MIWHSGSWKHWKRRMPAVSYTHLMAKAGETVTIKKITGKDEIRLHLAELGFVVDSEVTVVNEIAGNPVSYTHLRYFSKWGFAW